MSRKQRMQNRDNAHTLAVIAAGNPLGSFLPTWAYGKGLPQCDGEIGRYQGGRVMFLHPDPLDELRHAVVEGDTHAEGLVLLDGELGYLMPITNPQVVEAISDMRAQEERDTLLVKCSRVGLRTLEENQEADDAS